MKIRAGFVSNSSSSSFVCDICGREEGGWDITLEEAVMASCENNHIFCQDHILNTQDEIDLVLEAIYSNADRAEEFRDYLKCNDYTPEDIKGSKGKYIIFKYTEEFCWDLPFSICPLCNLKGISRHDVLMLLRKLTGLHTDEDVLKKLEELGINSYKDFREWLKA
ncbi:MAG: hypothetical protein DRN26_00410 [Thermoplasmata archaeon]|nr:MAG: hypothetical protein DRN26_00410 [Thermoplasmata archaeon]